MIKVMKHPSTSKSEIMVEDMNGHKGVKILDTRMNRNNDINKSVAVSYNYGDEHKKNRFYSTR